MEAIAEVDTLKHTDWIEFTMPKQSNPGILFGLDNFFASLVIYLALPLLPLFIEFIQIRALDDKTLALAVSMYVISVGFSSRSRTVFIMSIVVSIIFAFLYGTYTNQPTSSYQTGWTSALFLLLFFFVHAFERFDRHILQQAPVFEFEDKK